MRKLDPPENPYFPFGGVKMASLDWTYLSIIELQRL